MSASAVLKLAAERITMRKLDVAPSVTGALHAYVGGLIEVVGLVAPVGALCVVDRPGGEQLQAEVVGFRAGRLLLMPFADAFDLRPGARVRVLASGARVAVADALLGRVIDGAGAPVDGLGPIPATTTAPLHGRPAAPLGRGRVCVPLSTGVRAIDALTTLGRGQRVGLIAGSGVGKSVLLGMIARNAEADVVVVALVGERGREVTDFLENQLPFERRARSVIVASPADHAPVLRVRATLRAMCIAEYFRDQGKHVLLLIDSLTRLAHAQREIGIALGEPSSARGYPPSATALVGRVAERAGCSACASGAVTAVMTVLADGDDVQDPVVDAARAIMDGHILLDRALADAGQYPAIHPGRSISRCMPDLASEDQRRAAQKFRQLFTTYESNRDLVALGAWKAGHDLEVDAAITRFPTVKSFLCQRPKEIIPFEDSVARLIGEFGS